MYSTVFESRAERPAPVHQLYVYVYVVIAEYCRLPCRLIQAPERETHKNSRCSHAVIIDGIIEDARVKLFKIKKNFSI